MTQMTSFSAGDVNLTAMMAAENQLFKGYNALTLTEMNTTTVPAIAAGSAIEVNGVLVQSLTETAISGSPSDGVVYIYINGTTPTFTNTAPTWSDSKQGWYGTGGTANCRYHTVKCIKSGATYTKINPLIIHAINTSLVLQAGTPTVNVNVTATDTGFIVMRIGYVSGGQAYLCINDIVVSAIGCVGNTDATLMSPIQAGQNFKYSSGTGTVNAATYYLYAPKLAISL
jgi:hypothetical protein